MMERMAMYSSRLDQDLFGHVMVKNDVMVKHYKTRCQSKAVHKHDGTDD